MECSPIPTIGDTGPQTPVGSGTNMPGPTSRPRPNGGSYLHNSDCMPNTSKIHMYSSFTIIAGQVEPQKLTRLESNDELLGSDNSMPTGNITVFYPGEIPFRNQGTSTSPPEWVESQNKL